MKKYFKLKSLYNFHLFKLSLMFYKFTFFIIINLIFTSSLLAQDEVFTVVEEMPRFAGCEEKYDSLSRELNSYSKTKNAREQCAQEKLMEFMVGIKYPEIAREKNLQGKVFVRFVVNEVGNLINLEVARTSGHDVLDQAALTHFQNSPPWIPGKQRGKAVKVQYVVPINFKL